ncbi:hypothetical protein UPYG_G00199020 [Umbra pygmaea]|uniref:Ig-like domain-containing protein n=1 Tax=Umbra pygmaea TaxID=75934 RepID=A0ABD0WHS5_UMBPY
MGRIQVSLLPVALLIGSALFMGVVSLTIGQISSVKVHPGKCLILPCNNTRHAGVIPYWHTPFGRVQNSSLHVNQLDVVAMQQNGSLQINFSPYHSGLYYCLLKAGIRTTLTPYFLIASGQQEHVVNPRRVRSVMSEDNHAVVSDTLFASAVAASVVVTFVIGFSFGALSRTLLDRCVTWVRSLGQGRRKHGETFSVAFRKDVEHDGCPSVGAITIENLRCSPPAKPQRSFRSKRSEEGTAYLERCDQGIVQEKNEREMAEQTDWEESERDGEKKRSEIEESEGLKEGSEERRENQKEGEEDGCGSDSIDSEPASVGITDGGQEACPPLQPARQRRVIRLYQYDDEGHRYGHLPKPDPMDHSTSTSRQRSLSLTRLHTIMAAAASPLDPERPEPSPDQEREPASSHQDQERAVFQLEI